MSMNEKITLTLSIDQANLVLKGLGQLPYREVYQVVAEIQSQAQRQVKNDGKATASAIEKTSEG